MKKRILQSFRFFKASSIVFSFDQNDKRHQSILQIESLEEITDFVCPNTCVVLDIDSTIYKPSDITQGNREGISLKYCHSWNPSWRDHIDLTLCDPRTPEIIRTLQKIEDVKVIAQTSRPDYLRDTTVDQLQYFDINFDDENGAFSPSLNLFFPGRPEYEMCGFVYSKGMIFGLRDPKLSGYRPTKGEDLYLFFQTLRASKTAETNFPSRILFVDDYLEYVENVVESCSDIAEVIGFWMKDEEKIEPRMSLKEYNDVSKKAGLNPFHVNTQNNDSKIQNNNSKVVVINGTTSSGKTSVTDEMKKLMVSNFEFLHLDDYVTDVFDTYRGVDEFTNPLVAYEFFFDIMTATDKMYEDCVDIIGSVGDPDRYLFVDTILPNLQGESDVERGLYNLRIKGSVDVKLVLMYIPFDLLVERIKLRNEVAVMMDCSFENYRDISQVLRFDDMYEPNEDPRDTESIVGVLNRADLEYGFTVLAYEMEIRDSENLKGLEIEYQTEKERMLEKFGFFEDPNLRDVLISPKLNHDLVVDAHLASPPQIALKIKDFVR